MLLRRDRRRGQEREGPEASLVEVPPGEEEERTGERDRMEVAHGQPLHRRIGEIGDGERGSRPLRVEMLAREPVDRDRAGSDGDRLHDEQELGIRPDPPERSERGQDRIEVRPETGDLLAVDVGDREKVAVRGRPDGLRHVSEVEAPACRRRGAGGRMPCRRRPQRRRLQARRLRRASTADELLDEATPAGAEHVLARVRPVGGKAARTDALRQLRFGGEATHRRGQRLRVAGRDEQRALAVPQQLLGRRRVGGDRGAPRRPAPETPCSGSRGPPWRTSRRRPARNPRAGSPPGAARSPPIRPTRRSAAASSRSASSWPLPTTRNGISGTSCAAARIVSSPCSGISLPMKSAWNVPGGCQPGRKSRSSAPTKQTASRSAGNAPSPARCRAFCSVSATTRSARRSALRSTRRRKRACGRARLRNARDPRRASRGATRAG